MIKDDKYWVNVVYICWFLVAFYVGYQLLLSVGLYTGWVDKYSSYKVFATLLGAVLGGSVLFAYIKNPMTRKLHVSVVAELRKVTWPNMEVTKKLTWVVVIVVAFFAIVLGIFDLAWSWLLRQILMM